MPGMTVLLMQLISVGGIMPAQLRCSNMMAVFSVRDMSCPVLPSGLLGALRQVLCLQGLKAGHQHQRQCQQCLDPLLHVSPYGEFQRPF